MKYLTTLILLFVSVISFAEAKAQELSKIDKTEKSGPTFKATLFNKWEGPQLYVREKKEYVAINPAKYSYSASYRYTDDVVELLEKYTDSEGEAQYKPVIRVTIPLIIEEPLIVLIWNNKTKKALAKAIEFSPKKFKFGSYQIVNFSSKPIAGYIGKKTNKLVCKPNSAYITPFSFKEKEATPIVFYAQLNDQVKKVFGSITMHKERKRAIYLMYGEMDKLNRPVYQGTVIVDFKKAPVPN